ncbi:MAG TPA: DEAD/DEAH box helicase, partial [Streptosporangiaceae bacterium]
GIAVVTGMLHRLTADGRLVAGEFLPSLAGPQWCDAGVLRMLKRRCLAKLRQEAEPVTAPVLAAFLPAWQDALHDAPAAAPPAPSPGQGAWPPRRRGRVAGPDAVYTVIEQLAGAAVPAAALESLILPARVPGYAPAMLDELTAAGDVVWSGAGTLPGGDGWLVLAPAESAPLLLPPPGEITSTPVHDAVLDVLSGGGALFFRAIADRVVDATTASSAAASDGAAGRMRALNRVNDQAVAAAIWDLVWAGLLTNDTLAPLRTLLGAGKTWSPGPRRDAQAAPPAGPVPAGLPGSPGSPHSPGSPGQPPLGSLRLSGRRPGYGRRSLPSQSGPPTVSGRWSLLPPLDPDPTRRLHARALSLLDRHGIVIRGVAASERVPGGFGALYQVLRAMEETGQCRRGYFVEGLGAAQFALPGAVDRMRAMADSVLNALPGPDGLGPPVVVLAAADPANAYGAALPWPPRPDDTTGGHRPGRKAGALVILVAGQLVIYVERGGKTLLSWTSDPVLLGPATAALAGAVRAGALGKLTVERADGAGVYDSPLAQALEAAGFRPTPRGLRLRG